MTRPTDIPLRDPRPPTGTRTDIGAGIAAGIAELEKTDARLQGAIALVTDGKLDTEKGSDYVKPGNSAWVKLKQRADALAGRNTIASYALSLDSVTDAALLKGVLPEAEVIPVTKIDERFAELDSSVLRFQATRIVREDLSHGVVTTLDADLTTLAPGGGSIPATLRLQSTYTHIPVVVTDLTASYATGPSIDVAGLPAEVVLAPGQQQAVPVTLTYRGGGQGTLRIVGALTSPWAKVITDDLGLPFEAATTLDVATSVAGEPLAPGWASGWRAPWRSCCSPCDCSGHRTWWARSS